MGFSTKQWKAIRWFSESENLVPQMSAFPLVSFRIREIGSEVQYNISSIELAYKGYKESVRRQKALAAKEEKLNRQKSSKATN